MAAAPDPQRDTIFDLPWATITILGLILLGGVDVIIDGKLSADYRVFIDTIALPLAGLALGRGWAARKPG